MSNLPDGDTKSTRREFTQKLALLVATPLLPRAETSHAADEPPPPDPIAVTAALTEAARARFGKNLDEEHVKKVTASIQRGLFSAQALRRSKLTNADEPAFVFRADLP